MGVVGREGGGGGTGVCGRGEGGASESESEDSRPGRKRGVSTGVRGGASLVAWRLGGMAVGRSGERRVNEWVWKR